MANKFYDPGESRAAKVNDLFAGIARRYDLLNDLQSFGLHRRWKRRVVALANPQPGERALDLCCGTGDLALLFSERGANVIGLDFSAPMLAVAEQRQKAKGKGQNLKFIQGDALALPFTDASFDLVTIGYGLRNLASCEGGLREMRRVLKPGGRLVVLDFGKPRFAPWRAVYYAHLRFIAPMLGKIFCGDAAAYGYILESLKNYPAQEGVAALLRGLGFADVRVINLLGGAMSIHFARRT
ncbi:MAG: bifunctional demethylmenaquinone methyltransferase/2-methoxy-6-polyprenyl-1,4-benzoquinol methylase UbiE [Verrucomicrobia bacterium]|nr:bifunctional demethylmenaquinone methyltransferase/2-methoxy-6-polyprenyl-1,4-benzoquinol methylase UbiE [Verrucomicrobiota bacterium]